jgi:multidrug efflux system outer membrane protein
MFMILTRSPRPASLLLLITALTAAGVGGCKVGPSYKSAPATKSVSGYSALTGDDVSKASPERRVVSAENGGPGALAQWWKQLNDPTLDALILRAIESNLDLKIATARVREARAQRGVEASGLFPTVDAVGRTARERQSENINPQFPAPEDSQNLFQAGVDASWELDVFGGVRRRIEAADADLAATDEARRDVLISLIAEVATNYIDLRGFQQRIDLNNRTVAAQRETLELTQSLAKAGISSDLQVQQSASILATREAQLPPLYVGARAAAYRLSTLLGQTPEVALNELNVTGPLPVIPGEIPIGLPSDLLRRRPDIRRAERELAATTARVGVATADLFPRFSITGSFGLQSEEMDTFFNMNSRYWNIGPNVRWNVFDGKRIRNQIAAANVREEIAVTTYEKAILTSLEDVENSLTSFIQEQARRRSLIAAATASQRALDLATERYKSGIGDFLNVLDAQREIYQLQDQIVQSEIGVTRGFVSVYKALGGGWDDSQVQTMNAR